MGGVNWHLILLNPLLSRQGYDLLRVEPVICLKAIIIWRKKVVPRENLLSSFGFMPKSGSFLFIKMNGGIGQ
jgi:hypothetical protein